MYSPGVTGENHLRGIAKTDSDGLAWFTTIFPACDSGRWPHIHFEVYSSVAKAISNGPIVKTSRIATVTGTVEQGFAADLRAGT